MFAVAIVITALVTSAILSKWNWLVASQVHQWTTSDPKGAYLFVSKLLHPEILGRDFPFSDQRIFSFYQPVYLRLAHWISKRMHSVTAATRVLHFVFTFVYLMGWLTLILELTASWGCALITLFAVIPFVPVISADGISVGAPTTWWSRSMANAFIPWFFVLARTSVGADGGLIVPLAMLLALMVYFHPTAAIGLLVPFGCLLFYGFMRPLAAIELGLAAGIVAFGFFPFVFHYARVTAIEGSRTVWNVALVNELALKRFDLFPYPIGLDRKWSQFNRHIQIFIGVTCTVLILVLALLYASGSTALAFQGLLLLNLGTLVYLHLVPQLGMGLRLCVLAALGSFQMVHWLGPSVLAAVLVLLALSRFIRSNRAVAIFLIGIFASVMVRLVLPDERAELLAQVIAPWDWFLVVSSAALFIAYFWGCLFFMDILPLRLGKPLALIDWGRIVKIVQVPLYLYVMQLINQIVQRVDLAQPLQATASLLSLAAIVLCVLVNWQRAYRNEMAHEDLSLFDWARNTSPQAMFHVVSPDVWLSFNFRVNTLRSITGSWKDGGICYYAAPNRFLDWHERMELIGRALDNKDLPEMIRQATFYDADYLVFDRRTVRQTTREHPVVYSNGRYEVLAIQDVSLAG